MHKIKLENRETEQTPIPLIKIQKNKLNLGIRSLRNLVNIRSYFSSFLKIFAFPHRQRTVVLAATNQMEASGMDFSRLPLFPQSTKKKR